MSKAEALAYLQTVASRDVPLAAYCSFKVGGPADYFLAPRSKAELTAAYRAAVAAELPIFVLGRGSNVLIADRGVRGLTLYLGALQEELRLIAATGIYVDAGFSLAAVAAFAARHDLSGLEFAAGIPGSLGGAVLMNAGAYDGMMADRVVRVRALDRQGDLHTYERDELDYGYRHSRFMQSGEVVVGAELALQPGESTAIYAKMRELQAKRRASQPLELPSAGSAFKRPEGYFAGKLISDCGLKGYRGQGCSVSAKHAGFIVKDGAATAEDLRALFMTVHERVLSETSVRLVPEVRFCGDWGEAKWIWS